MTAAGVVTTLAGLASNAGNVDGTGSAARFRAPSGIVVDGAGTLWVADTNNSTIRQIAAGAVVTTFAGTGLIGSADGTGVGAGFFSPNGVTISGGVLFVADTGNDTDPEDHQRRGRDHAGRIQRESWRGRWRWERGALPPSGRCRGRTERRHVRRRYHQRHDSQNHALGVVTTFAGLAGSSGSVDGTGSAARFFRPGGIAVDSAGTIYVSDQANQNIRQITPGGVVTTIAGLAGSPGSADGTGSAARFNGPRGDRR